MQQAKCFLSANSLSATNYHPGLKSAKADFKHPLLKQEGSSIIFGQKSYFLPPHLQDLARTKFRNLGSSI
jgi:hypothetical protein